MADLKTHVALAASLGPSSTGKVMSIPGIGPYSKLSMNNRNQKGVSTLEHAKASRLETNEEP